MRISVDFLMRTYCFFVLSFLLSATSHAQPLEMVESQVRDWYREKFVEPIAGRFEIDSEISESYAPPMLYVSIDQIKSLEDRDAIRAHIASFDDTIASEGVIAAEVPKLVVKALNERAVLLIASWRWLNQNNQVVSECDPFRYLYVVSRLNGDWSVVFEADVSCESREFD